MTRLSRRKVLLVSQHLYRVDLIDVDMAKAALAFTSRSSIRKEMKPIDERVSSQMSRLRT